MGIVDGILTVVIISIVALVGLIIVSVIPTPTGPLRETAISFRSSWSDTIVLGVVLAGGLGFTTLAMLANLR